MRMDWEFHPSFDGARIHCNAKSANSSWKAKKALLALPYGRPWVNETLLISISMFLELLFFKNVYFGQIGFPKIEPIILVDFPWSVTTWRWQCNQTLCNLFYIWRLKMHLMKQHTNQGFWYNLQPWTNSFWQYCTMNILYMYVYMKLVMYWAKD